MVKRLAMAMVGSNALRVFQTFMARVIALEDMAKLSSQMLAVFQQELDMFRRSPLNNSSTLAQVLAKEPSERLKAYQDAGYRHCHTDHAVLVKLDNALKFLQNHVQRAREVTEELQKLLEEANGIMHDDLSARLGNVALTEGVKSSETAQVGNLGQGVGIGQIFSPNLKVRQLLTSDYVTTMAAIYGMLQQDFVMQQRVVVTLGLDLSSELLQNYQMMWTLRPFVDESVVEEALTWTSPSTVTILQILTTNSALDRHNCLEHSCYVSTVISTWEENLWEVNWTAQNMYGCYRILDESAEKWRSSDLVLRPS